MEFFNSAVDTLQTIVVGLGGALCVWGGINLLGTLVLPPQAWNSGIFNMLRSLSETGGATYIAAAILCPS